MGDEKGEIFYFDHEGNMVPVVRRGNGKRGYVTQQQAHVQEVLNAEEIDSYKWSALSLLRVAEDKREAERVAEKLGATQGLRWRPEIDRVEPRILAIFEHRDEFGLTGLLKNSGEHIPTKGGPERLLEYGDEYLGDVGLVATILPAVLCPVTTMFAARARVRLDTATSSIMLFNSSYFLNRYLSLIKDRRVYEQGFLQGYYLSKYNFDYWFQYMELNLEEANKLIVFR